MFTRFFVKKKIFLNIVLPPPKNSRIKIPDKTALLLSGTLVAALPTSYFYSTVDFLQKSLFCACAWACARGRVLVREVWLFYGGAFMGF